MKCYYKRKTDGYEINKCYINEYDAYMFSGIKKEMEIKKMKDAKEQIKNDHKLWNKLIKELKLLNDNDFTARKLYTWIVRYYLRGQIHNRRMR